MTDAQFYFSIVIQSALITITCVSISLAWMHKNKRISRIEAALGASRRNLRVEIITLRTDAIEQRLKD